MNPIFITTHDPQRFARWCKNVTELGRGHKPTHLYVVVDCRKLPLQKLRAAHDAAIENRLQEFRNAANNGLPKDWTYSIISSADLLQLVQRRASKVTDSTNFNVVYSLYPPSIKVLVPIYARYSDLNLRKFMLLDDDTFFLKPVDSFFKHKCVVKSKSTNRLKTEPMVDMFHQMFPEVTKKYIRSTKHLINSGHFIMTWKDSYLKAARNFFASESAAETLMKIHQKHGKMNRGAYWMLEEYFFGLYLNHTFGKDTKKFASAVRLIKINPLLNSKFAQDSIRKLPHIIHLLPKDKLQLFSYYEPLIRECLNRDEHQKT